MKKKKCSARRSNASPFVVCLELQNVGDFSSLVIAILIFLGIEPPAIDSYPNSHHHALPTTINMLHALISPILLEIKMTPVR